MNVQGESASADGKDATGYPEDPAKMMVVTVHDRVSV